MSPASHAYQRLCRLYGVVLRHMRQIEWQLQRPNVSRQAALEALEPRQLLAGVAPGPNIGSAAPLTLVEDPASSRFFIGRGTDAIDAAGAVDYWSFEALAGDMVSITVNTPDSGLDPERPAPCQPA